MARPSTPVRPRFVPTRSAISATRRPRRSRRGPRSSISAARRRRGITATARSTGSPMRSRAGCSGAGSSPASGSRSCRPTGPSSSPAFSAPCGPGSSRCRSTGSCPPPPSTRSCAIATPGWCCATQRAGRFARPTCRAFVFGDNFTELLDPGPFRAVEPDPSAPAMFLYTSGSSGRPKGVVLSHRSHLWVIEMRRRPADQKSASRRSGRWSRRRSIT